MTTSAPATAAEVFTDSPGKLAPIEDAVRGSETLIEGRYDPPREKAFLLVGAIEEAVEKAERLAVGA